jgi:hydrogenase maturation protein HypF
MFPSMSERVERRLIELRGVVQGVGLRPFVYRLASRLQLRGRVRNGPRGVVIDVEGASATLHRFVEELRGTGVPPLAQIDSLDVAAAAPHPWSDFQIEPSTTTQGSATLIAPDIATCDACLREVQDPANRRWNYPFTNCTNCGPRLTIIEDVPYDRPRTTMARFVMCADCRREYDDPADRRFHAQPIACAACGPSLAWWSAGAETLDSPLALRAAIEALRAGCIVAVKGLGGYHLACDATDAGAVERLRMRKRRDAKPFALLACDVEQARQLVHLSGTEIAVLESPQRPIVLARRKDPSPVSDSVAPGAPCLGVMLPYSPLHSLLSAGCGRPLVLTSGNVANEPIAYRSADARARLSGLADGFLSHDRPIRTRCDDSVVRVSAGPRAEIRFIRRSRGFAPKPIRLQEESARPLLALGGHLKNTFCLLRGSDAFVSHHIGDLENPAAYRSLRDGISHYAALFAVAPEVVAHDQHPDYLSTQLARSLALPRIPVQHHHAHVASCLAEHGVCEPVIGVVFDGAGLGPDGAVWGGEFLVVEGAGYERVAHLAYVPLPGGDAAAREPWRMGVAHLWSAYGDAMDSAAERFVETLDARAFTLIRQIVRRRIGVPTSSVGRLFDAVASLIGVDAARSQYEGQAATQLEAIASQGECGSYPFDLAETGSGWEIDPRGLIRAVNADLLAGRPATQIAGAFHQAIADFTVATVVRVSGKSGIRRVALTGGVFQNALLEDRTATALTRAGFEVLIHRLVPCNDGGLSLGQALIAARAGEDACV